MSAVEFILRHRYGQPWIRFGPRVDSRQIEDAAAAEFEGFDEESFGYIAPYQGSAIRQSQATSAALQTGAPGPRNNPCDRFVALERQLGRKSPRELEELRLALAAPDAATMDECALMIDERLEAEALRRGISKAELKKTLRA